MQIPDVNVLIYAHREELPEHESYAAWLTRLAEGNAPFGASELALFGFVRIVTNRRAFKTPTPIDHAFAFVDALYSRPGCVRLRPGPKHWNIFKNLCRGISAAGKLTSDAHHAALAIEHGCEIVTADSDFARFEGLRWRHPLAPR